MDYRELCSGLGALGRGADFAGFRGVGVNELQQRTAEVAAKVSGCSVVIGDVSQDDVLMKLWQAFPRKAGVMLDLAASPSAILATAVASMILVPSLWLEWSVHPTCSRPLDVVGMCSAGRV